MLPLPGVPPVPISRGRTRDFLYRWVHYNGMDNVEWKLNIQDTQIPDSVILRSVYKKQSLSLDDPLCRDLMLPRFPLSKIGAPSTCPLRKEKIGKLHVRNRISSVCRISTWVMGENEIRITGLKRACCITRYDDTGKILSTLLTFCTILLLYWVLYFSNVRTSSRSFWMLRFRNVLNELKPDFTRPSTCLRTRDICNVCTGISWSHSISLFISLLSAPLTDFTRPSTCLRTRDIWNVCTGISWSHSISLSISLLSGPLTCPSIPPA